MPKQKKRGKQTANNKLHVEQLERRLQKRGPGDEWHAPTPERVAQAKRAGSDILAEIIETEHGNPTGNYAWRIEPMLDGLLRRSVITEEEAQIAERYMRYYAGSRHTGATTSRFLPYYDRGFQELAPAERAIHYGNARVAAIKAVRPALRPCLIWLEFCCHDELPLWVLGREYYPNASQSQQSMRAVAFLHMTLDMLAEHWGWDNKSRFSRQDVEAAIALCAKKAIGS